MSYRFFQSAVVLFCLASCAQAGFIEICKDNSPAAGSLSGLATFAGSFAAGSSLAANVSVTGLTPISSQLAMAYNWQSSTPSSLSIIGGVYSAPSVGQAVTVDATSGAITGNVLTACAISGIVSVPEPTRNIYKIAATLSGTGCPANGPVSLLGFYYTATSGQQEVLMFGVSAGGQSFVTLTMARHG